MSTKKFSAPPASKKAAAAKPKAVEPMIDLLNMDAAPAQNQT